jgi:hypothetical protein
MDIVDRLYHHLTQAIERGGAPPRGRTLTIADVYQQLIPYRAVRSELGVWELAEYEHALVRLLAGERGYVSLGTLEARDELIRELASSNPILGIYRDYPAVQVVIAAAAESEPESAPAVPEPEKEAPAPHACGACGADLPDLRGLRYCPACGTDQTEAVCAGCDAPLRAEWNFCIRCGAPRGGGERRERTAR